MADKKPSVATNGDSVKLGETEYKVTNGKVEKYTVVVIKEPPQEKKELEDLRKSFVDKIALLNDYIDQIDDKLDQLPK